MLHEAPHLSASSSLLGGTMKGFDFASPDLESRRIGLRWRVVLTLAAAVVTTFVVGAALVYSQAAEERHVVGNLALAVLSQPPRPWTVKWRPLPIC